MAERKKRAPAKKRTTKRTTGKRTGAKDDGYFTGSFRVGCRATGTLVKGMVSAVGAGVGAYADCLTSEKLTRYALNNGLIEGAFRGYARFFGEMAATAEQVVEDIADAPDLFRRSPK